MIDPAQLQGAPPPPMSGPPAVGPAPPPTLPGPGSSPTMPTGIPAMPPKPAAPPPLLPPIQRTTIPNERPPADKVNNSFERVATLLVDHVQDQAQRLSRNLNEAPADSVPQSREDLKKAWYFSPAGNALAADQLFWQTHDKVLQETGGDHQQAEQKALEAAYPQRAELVGVGTANAETQVAKAEKLRKIIDGDQAPDSEQVGREHHETGAQIRYASGSI